MPHKHKRKNTCERNSIWPQSLSYINSCSIVPSVRETERVFTTLNDNLRQWKITRDPWAALLCIKTHFIDSRHGLILIWTTQNRAIFDRKPQHKIKESFALYTQVCSQLLFIWNHRVSIYDFKWKHLVFRSVAIIDDIDDIPC